MNRFIEEVARKGRLERAKPWDKEGPRVLAKNFDDTKSWFFTTFGFVFLFSSFEELDAMIREDEVALRLLRQPSKKCDSCLLLPPCEVSWETREVAKKRGAGDRGDHSGHGQYLVPPACNSLSLARSSSRLHKS
jgi:hypothetical protein